MDATSLMAMIICTMVFFATIMILAAIRICPEYARGVVFRLGRFIGIYGPGLFITMPIIDRVLMVEVREQTRTLEAQSAITADNVRLVVDLTWRYRVIDPAKSVLNVANLNDALQKLGQQAWLTAVEAQAFSDILHNRSRLRDDILQQLQTASANWGVEITGVQLGEIKKG
jgi:regulator of protease activity HflC (stomatin/prohibitin superfamily)